VPVFKFSEGGISPAGGCLIEPIFQQTV